MTTEELNQVAARAELLESLPPVEERARIRRALGYSISALSRMTGCSREYIRRFEDGRTVPTGEHLVALASFFDAARGRRVAA